MRGFFPELYPKKKFVVTAPREPDPIDPNFWKKAENIKILEEAKKHDPRLFKKIVIAEDGAWNWMGYVNRDGYGEVFRGENGKRRRRVVHKYILFLFAGAPPPDKPFACHKCKQNRLCCNPAHLYWGDQLDQEADKRRDGTHFRRGKEPVPNEVVRYIRRVGRTGRKKGISNIARLAKKLNIHRGVVGAILKRIAYKHVPEEETDDANS